LSDVSDMMGFRTSRSGRGVGMESDENRSMRRTVQLVIISLVVTGLYLAGFNVLLSIVVAMVPLWYTNGFGPAGETGPEADPRLMVQRLQRAQRSAWHELVDRAHMMEFLRARSGRPAAARPGAALLPVRIAAWPEIPGPAAPFAPPGQLTGGQVVAAVSAVSQSWRTVVVTGDEDTGKTTLLLLMLLQAEHVLDAVDPDAPVPLRVSLAGWPDEPELTLREWIDRRVREDYPGLLGPGESLSRLLDWLWGADELAPDRLLLFIDGIDVVPAHRREQVLAQVLAECDGRLAVLACRTATWAAVAPADRRDWVELHVSPPTADDVATFLAPVPELAHRLERAGPAADRLRRNPRLLALLREAYPDPKAPPAWLYPPPPDAGTTHRSMWADLLGRVSWPASLDRGRAEHTLRWLARCNLFENTRFEWWRVPGRAADDPALARADRYLRLRRAGSVMLWALGAFAIGAAVLLVLLDLGTVQGYDHADQGLNSAGGLRWADVTAWNWDLRTLPHVLGNPAYLAVLEALLAAAVVAVLTFLGRNLEHPDGGQPQTLRIGLPGLRELPLVVRALPRRAVGVLAAAVAVGGVLELSGNGAARQLWASCTLAGLFLVLLAWLHWCAEAPTEPALRTPAGLFAADQASTRIVALWLGGALALAAGVLSWWFTAFGHIPTMGQGLGIITSVSLAVGVGRGLFLGAGMGTSWLLRLRPGFGLGYAARLEALELALRRRPPAGGREAPWAVIGLLGLADRSPRPAALVNGRGAGSLPRESLLRPVGSHIRLRESSLEAYLRDTAAPADPPRPAPRRAVGWLSAAALVPAVALAFLTATGSAAVMLPRLPCFDWSTTLDPPGSVALDRWRSTPRSRTWLENGQCVGFVVPGIDGRPRSVFDSRGSTALQQERERQSILGQIAEVNRQVDVNDPKAVTVLFLAPLTRVHRGGAINALWQLQGALAALRSINERGALPVRLVVANSGENFTSGPSVVQTLTRTFPRTGPWSIAAVIGIAQSRASTREALAEFRDVPVIAASVSGRQLWSGIGSETALHADFRSLAPGDDQAAGAMLAPAVLAAVTAADPAGPPSGSTSGPRRTLHVVGDPRDTYFSRELMIELRDRVRAAPASAGIRLGPDVVVTEADGAHRVDAAARQICAAPHDVWLFTGRGPQLTDLDHRMHGLRAPDGSACRPLIVAGPGVISAVASSDEADSRLTSMTNLFSYALLPAPWPAFQRAFPGDPAGPVAIERDSDRATGYLTLLEAARIKPSPYCPGDPGPLGVGRDANGHNPLGPGDDPCAVPGGTRIWFCPFQNTSAPVDLAVTPPASSGSATAAGRPRGTDDCV
jgi:hypothetical protein